MKKESNEMSIGKRINKTVYQLKVKIIHLIKHNLSGVKKLHKTCNYHTKHLLFRYLYIFAPTKYSNYNSVDAMLGIPVMKSRE